MMSDEIWFLGRVSRQKAEEVVHAAGVNGSFVIRSSESIFGAFALSVLYNKSIHTYRILPTDNQMLAVQTSKGVQQRRFTTLNDLVREYRSPQNGLICGLTNPVGTVNNMASKPPKFDQVSTTSRKEPLPSLPPPGSTMHKSMGQNIGIKVMPTVPVQQPPALGPTSSPEKLSRDLPPVPNRDASLRPLSKSQSLHVPSTSKKETAIRDKLLARLSEIKAIWPAMNSEFFDVVQHYSGEDGLSSDLTNLRKGGNQCAELQALLAREAVAFQSELEKFLTKIDLLRQLFDFNSSPRRTHSYNRGQDTDVDLETFLGRLGDCQTVVKALNMRVCINLQEQLGVTGSSSVKVGHRKKFRHIDPVMEKTFEVKQDGALKYSRQKLKLDIMNGRLSVIKGDDTTNHDHSKVLQIVKNQKSNNKLSIVFDGSKKRDYTFEQSQHREAFCQLMQHMRNKHCESTEPDCVSIFCGSWNMGDAMPPNDISSWFLCNGQGRSLDKSVQAIPHDIYVVGTQETGMPEKDWQHKIMDTLQEVTESSFHAVVMDALWHIKIMVIVKEEHKNRISHVQTSSVKTGIANALGNKGAVAVSFQFSGTSFCFINAHLTSGAEKCLRRNQNYHDIIRSLNLGKNSFKSFDLTNRFDHLFFLGDLNYRLDMEVHQILESLKRKELSSLTNVDQLKREKGSNKAFVGFDEEEILFPPTYRYERGTRETYSYLKVKKTGVRINVPSWCDRVLWRSYPETHNVCLAYGCSEDIMTSDHSPLFSNFQVGVRGQYVSKEGSVKSSRTSKLESSDPGVIRLMWKQDTAPILSPMISDRDYLVDHHILVCICSEDDNEVIGECVIALRSKIGDSPQPFQMNLFRKGDEVGMMRGEIQVKARDSQAHKEKTYDFIRRDDDEIASRRDMVQEASYADINLNAQTPEQMFSSDPMMHANDLVTGEDEYADPDAVKLEPVPSSSRSPVAAPAWGPGPTSRPSSGSSPHSLNTSRHSSSSSPRNLSPSSPRRAIPQPKPMSSPINGQTNFTDTQTRLKPSVAEKPVRRPNHPSPRLSSHLSSPYRPNSPKPSGNPMTSPKQPELIVDLQLSEALAEFSQAEQDFKSISMPTPPNTPMVQPSQIPEEQSIYQIPNNLPAPGSPEFINTRIGNPATFPSGSSTFPKPASSTQPLSATTYRRRPNESRGSPSNVDEFLQMINMEQYSGPLRDNGWDSIEFLGEITEDDLFEIGITDPQHCRVILEYIQTLPR